MGEKKYGKVVGKNRYGGWTRMGEKKYGMDVGKNGYGVWARMGENKYGKVPYSREKWVWGMGENGLEEVWDGCREKVIQGGFVSTLTKNKNSAADPN